LRFAIPGSGRFSETWTLAHRGVSHLKLFLIYKEKQEFISVHLGGWVFVVRSERVVPQFRYKYLHLVRPHDENGSGLNCSGQILCSGLRLLRWRCISHYPFVALAAMHSGRKPQDRRTEQMRLS
jgi:hypothetical protein